ncbi:MAG: sterol desaturase family protein [Terriglobia bacterium]
MTTHTQFVACPLPAPYEPQRASLPTARKARAAALDRGHTIKRVTALTAVLCGGVPATILGVWFPSEPEKWLVGFLVGLVWANGFEYAYHRFLLHLARSFFARRHLLHHGTTGTPAEAEHVNLGGSPVWIALLFAANGAPVVAADVLFGLGVAPAMLVAFVAYFVGVEEIHWRIHLGGWLPPGLRSARARHLAHHQRPNAHFNVFLPLFDWLLGSASG